MKILGLKTVLVGAVLGVVWAGLGGVAAANGQTAPKRPMTFADLMAMKRVSDPQISPSGKWVLFSVMDVSLEKNTKVTHLWVVPLGSSGGTNAGILPSGQNDKQERQVTFGDGETFGRFSPDGKWVSMTMKDQIVLAPWNEEQGRVGEFDYVNMVRLTNVAGGADGAIWSPDSKRLMFTADVYPECSDKPTWAEENACDKAKDDAAAASPVKAQVWDGLLYRHWDQYTGQKRSHILVVDADGKNTRDLTPRSAVGDAETPTWFLSAPLQYAWAPDSKEIAYVTNLDKVPAASTNNDVFTLRIDEPGAKAVKVSTSLGSDDAPAYSPDGKWLAFRSQKQAGFESDRFRLMLYDREKKTISELMPKFDYWVDEFTWAPDSNALFFASSYRGEEPIFRILITASDPNKIIWECEGCAGGWGSSEMSDVHVSPNGKTVVATRMSASQPAEIDNFDISQEIIYPCDACFGGSTPVSVGGKLVYGAIPPYSGFGDPLDVSWRKLTHLNDELVSELQLSHMESFFFTGADGANVEGFIMKPPSIFPIPKKYPVKFVMHGGPQTALGDSWSYRWNWELLAADGYVVVGINRRGSTGYGQKFVDEVSGDWGGRAYQDLMKGLDYAETKFPFIDKTRECALGASYGGFMADWVLTHTSRFKCIVTHDGMSDPVSAFGTTEEMWFNEWEFRRPEDFPKGWDGFSAGYDPMGQATKTTTEILTGGQNDEQKQNAGILRSAQNDKLGGGHAAEPWRYQNLSADQDSFRKWSPMRSIENAKTPTLIIHSQRDYRLDVSQGFELYTALQRRNVPARFLYFPDEGHWVLKPQNSQLWYQTVNDWCDRWTKSGKYAEKQ